MEKQCGVKKFQNIKKGKKSDDLGFYHKALNGNQYIFFLDNKKNIDIFPDETPELHISGKGGFLMCIKIDTAGNISKQAVLDTREEDIQLPPRGFDYIGGNLIIDRLKESRKTSRVFKLTIL